MKRNAREHYYEIVVLESGVAPGGGTTPADRSEFAVERRARTTRASIIAPNVTKRMRPLGRSGFTGPRSRSPPTMHADAGLRATEVCWRVGFRSAWVVFLTQRLYGCVI